MEKRSQPRKRANCISRLAESRWGIVCVLVLFVILGLAYGVATPVFETPDEPWHFLYAKRLADGDGLPPLTFSDDPWEQGEAHQPPLYYALSALAISWVDTGDWQVWMQRNPHAAPGAPGSFGNKNVVLHGIPGTESWAGTGLAVHLLRLLSLALSALTVWVTHELMKELFPDDPVIALSGAVIIAFNPQFLFISAAVNNDSLITLLCSVALLVIIRGMRKGLSLRWATGLGLVIGAAMLTKLGGFGLLVPAWLSIAWLAWRERRWQTFVRYATIVACIAMAVSAWWYVRNLVLFRDPLGMRALVAAFRTHDRTPTLLELLRTTGDAEISFWGVFGWMNVLAGEWFYVVVRVLGRLSILGVGIALVRWWRRGRVVSERVAKLLVLGAWMLVVLSSLISWSREVTGPQGRLLFPAITSVAALLIMGLSALWPDRSRRILVVAAPLFLLVAAAIMPFAYISPPYEVPPIIAAADLPADLQQLNITFDNGIRLVGYRVGQESVVPGEKLDVYLYWQALDSLDDNYSVFVHLFGRGRESLGQVDSYPGKGNYPTGAWEPDGMICDHYRVEVAEDALVPTAGRIEVGLYRLPGYENVPATDGQGCDIGTAPDIGGVRIGPSQPAPCQPPCVTAVVFGDRVELMGYHLSHDALISGEQLSVTLYWRVTQVFEQDYTVFVHLVGEDGLAGQADSQPLQGEYPTSFWMLGETLKDEHLLEVYPDASPGQYRLEVGLYLLEDGERLVASGEGDHGQDYAVLGPVEVLGP